MPRLEILPLEKEDIPRVHELSIAAFSNDANTLFKAFEKGGEIGDELPTPALEGWIDHAKNTGRMAVVKAVVNGEVQGWSAWGFWNLNGDKQPQPGDSHVKPLDAPINHPDFPNDPSLPLITQIQNLTSAHLFTIQERLNRPGERVVYCMSICVDPSAHSQGIGTAMVQYAVDIADKHGASMWVHGSEDLSKTKLFSKFGFEEVNRLTIDLDKYRTKAMPEGREKWGLYSHPILQRRAKVEACWA